MPDRLAGITGPALGLGDDDRSTAREAAMDPIETADLTDSPAESRAPGDASVRDLSISMERANVSAAVLLPLLVAACLGPFWAMWGWDALSAGGSAVFLTWLFVPAFLLAIVAHEALHAAGFLLAGAAPRALHFGVDRATLSPYAGCSAPVAARGYRLAVLLPGLVLGVLPWLYGVRTGAGWAAVWGTVMIVTAAGDALVLWVVRGVRGGTPVLDHPTRVGCRIIEPTHPPGTRAGRPAETGTRRAS